MRVRAVRAWDEGQHESSGQDESEGVRERARSRQPGSSKQPEQKRRGADRGARSACARGIGVCARHPRAHAARAPPSAARVTYAPARGAGSARRACRGGPELRTPCTAARFSWRPGASRVAMELHITWHTKCCENKEADAKAKSKRKSKSMQHPGFQRGPPPQY